MYICEKKLKKEKTKQISVTNVKHMYEKQQRFPCAL